MSQGAISGMPGYGLDLFTARIGGGFRLGAAYAVHAGGAVIRPLMTLDGIYVNVPGYSQSGSALPAVSFDTNSGFTVIATPGMDLARRFTLGDGMALNLTAHAGISVLSTNQWTTHGHFVGDPAGVGGFSTELPIDSIVGRIGIGAELLHGPMFSLRAAWDGAYSQHAMVNTGTLAAAAAQCPRTARRSGR